MITAILKKKMKRPRIKNNRGKQERQERDKSEI